MWFYVLRRCLRVGLSLVAVSVITFVLLEVVPGSFAQLAGQDLGSGLGDGEFTSGQDGDTGSSRSAAVRYVSFMGGAVTGNMGPSWKYPQMTVEQIIGHAFPISLSLAGPAVLLALAISVPAGILAAVFKDSWLDHTLMLVLTTIAALPGYLMALVLVLVLAAWLGLLSTGGWNGPQDTIIPILALAVQPIAVLARYVRSSALEVLGEEYVVAVHAKGGPGVIIMLRHVLRNSLIPLVTVVGPMFANLATGTVFIEALMSIPGLGMYFTVAARTRDMPLLMGTTLFFALLIMLTNLVVDILYGYLDPRIRVAQAEGTGRRSGGRTVRRAPTATTSIAARPL